MNILFVSKESGAGDLALRLEMQLSDVISASGGDTLQLKCFQNSVGGVTTDGDNMVFTIQKLW